MAFENLFTARNPVVEIRGVHLDLKGTPPTAQRLVDLLKVFSAARYNAVLVEWEDSFPWTVDERFRSETAYSPDEVKRFGGQAETLGIEIIPLVQCLGHMETPLSVPGYEGLREVPDDSFVLNPLAPGARDLVQKMIDDVVALLPFVQHFHLGGDEAWSFGTHPDTKAYVQARGKGALYMHHVEPILDALGARGIRPILWHDMMIDFDGAALRALAAKADLLVWGYRGHPDTAEHHYNSKYIDRFRQHGLTLWGGTAYKGGDGHNVDRPNLQARQMNALAWAEVAKRYGFVGVIATAWSRYGTHRVQCEPIDAALDSLVNVGVILHDGAPPGGGIEACVEALAGIGEKQRFESCKAAMEKLTAVRSRGWQAVRNLREQVVTSTLDPRRRGSHASLSFLRRLRQAVGEADAVAGQVESAFAGLMEPIWVERYLAERLEPLRQELADLAPRVRQLDPTGY